VTRVDADVGELADVGVGHDLEGESCERLVDVSLAGDRLARVGIGALGRRNVKRGRQVVADCVKKLLDALVLVGRAHEDEVDLVGDDALAQGSLDLVDRRGLVLENLLHEVVVEVGGLLEKLIVLLLCLLLELVRNLVHDLRVDHALGIFLEVPCLHGDEVDEAPEVSLCAHRDLGCDSVGAQTVLHRVDGVPEVRADTVILVDEGDARDVVVVGLAPDRLGLGLDTGDSIEDSDSAVENTQGTLDLSREVDVARGVDDLDDMVLPEARRSCGRNGNAALLLLNHPVHRCCAVVDLADLVGLAGVVEDALRGRGLACIDMGHDADIAQVMKVILWLCHILLLRSRLVAVVREGAVGLCHLVEVLATLHGCADAVGGIENLGGKALGHRLLLAGTGEVHEPADSQRRGTTGVDLHRNLIGCATDTTRLDLEGRADVVHGLLEDGQGILAGLLCDDIEGTIDDALCGRLLAVKKDLVDKLGDQTVVVLCIRLDLAADCCCTTRHVISPLS
jgi:hypothetical protein